MELGDVTVGLSQRGHWREVFVDCHCGRVLVDEIYLRVPLRSDNIQNTLIEENILVLSEEGKEESK